MSVVVGKVIVAIIVAFVVGIWKILVSCSSNSYEDDRLTVSILQPTVPSEGRRTPFPFPNEYIIVPTLIYKKG